jgi:hypothetical protein
MTHRLLHQWFASIRRFVLTRLELDHPQYRQRILNNRQRLHAVIRKGDLVLVEGRSRMSGIIKLFSSSHWSHVALYVGDALIQPGQPDREYYLQTFGPDATRLLIEAYTGQGVIVSPLDKYIDFNIRICRPYGIEQSDLNAVVSDVIDHIGRRYDNQNILEIALMVLASVFRPNTRRSNRTCLGSCNDFQVICSGMIAKAFQNVGYPIIPALNPTSTDKCNPYGAKLIMRHFSQILPRDFDLSPNFEVIKFNIIGQTFNYHELWQERLDHTP